MLKQGEVDVSVVRMPFSEDGLGWVLCAGRSDGSLDPCGIHCDREKTTLMLSELSRQSLV
ncbi:MAG: hypothetical protein DUD39_11085 [Coriobacteriaceae bacterium]|nr:MAG: hypothetical protein DUD39_11085 [Coriobacteriaceae bacterium]